MSVNVHGCHLLGAVPRPILDHNGEPLGREPQIAQPMMMTPPRLDPVLDSGFSWTAPTTSDNIWICLSLARWMSGVIQSTDIVITANNQYDLFYLMYGTRENSSPYRRHVLKEYPTTNWDPSGIYQANPPFEGMGFFLDDGDSPTNKWISSTPSHAYYGGFVTFTTGAQWVYEFLVGETGTLSGTWRVQIRTSSGAGYPGSFIYEKSWGVSLTAT